MQIVISSTGLQDGWASAEDTHFEQPLPYSLRSRENAILISDFFETPDYRKVAAKRLAGAVRIPTVTYDGMGKVGTDPRWNVFYSFARYLKDTFPVVHDKLGLETINEHALLYTWAGTDLNLKPLLFMAHTDVVPAPESTLDRWTYPPFSGHYDGEFVWGRGSEDDKSNLIAILSSIEALLQCGFTPTRTVLVSIGFDEEGGADQSNGARCLADQLLERYGEAGIELIFDEGIGGIEERFGSEFAMPATAEKGYMDVKINIDTAGGHSSIPPDHTAIGYLAQAIQTIEANAFESRLTSANPTMKYLKCIATQSKNMPLALRKAILDPASSSEVLEFMNSSRETRSLVRTSTAVDIIRGGENSNALPENAYAIVNHRIAVEDSVQILKNHYLRMIAPLAKDWGYRLIAFGKQFTPSNHDFVGTIALSGHYELEPSPVSNHEDIRFKWLARTIQAVFGEEVHVAPVLLTGNTDTKFYWKLSSQIYRMSPWRASLDPRGSHMHTVDERMPIEGLLDMIRFYHEFILVVDASRR